MSPTTAIEENILLCCQKYGRCLPALPHKYIRVHIADALFEKERLETVEVYFEPLMNRFVSFLLACWNRVSNW